MSTQIALLRNLCSSGVVKSPAVARALALVDRAHYIPTEAPSQLKGRTADHWQELTYADHPLPIGFNATISAPHMHAIALELLLPSISPGCRILDLGSGSGYLTTALAALVAPTVAAVLAPSAASSVAASAAAAAAVASEGSAPSSRPGELADVFPMPATVPAGALGSTPAEVEAALAALACLPLSPLPQKEPTEPATAPSSSFFSSSPPPAPSAPTSSTLPPCSVPVCTASAPASARAAALPPPLAARLRAELQSRVVGLEHMPELAAAAEESVRNRDPLGAALSRLGVIRFVNRDGREGWPALSPYAGIHVGAATAPATAAALRSQLQHGGALVVPVDPASTHALPGQEAAAAAAAAAAGLKGRGVKWMLRSRGDRDGGQVLVKITRVGEDSFVEERMLEVAYVPFTDARTQMKG